MRLSGLDSGRSTQGSHAFDFRRSRIRFRGVGVVIKV